MGKTYRIQLSLKLDDGDLSVLRKYGKVQNGIIREILVPDCTTLQSLHYVIQRAFGWQNAHDHSFELPEKPFDRLVEGKFLNWIDYCGMYFAFPTEEEDEEDDEEEYEYRDVKAYLRHKYADPSRYEGWSGHFLEGQNMARSFVKENETLEIPQSYLEWEMARQEEKGEPKVKAMEAVTVQDGDMLFAMFGGLNVVNERLQVREILGDGTPMSRENIRIIYHALYPTYDFLQYRCRKKKADIDDLEMLLMDTDIETAPITGELTYRYDAGENWTVSVKLLEIIEDALVHRPVCVAADGLPVMEDVGGVSGYCDFLRGLNGETESPPAEYRAWAREMGWTGRESKPENLL